MRTKAEIYDIGGNKEMERRTCRRCGNIFTTKGSNTMCRDCISAVLDDELAIRETTKPKRKKRSQLERDVKAADTAGLSYGQYMAWKEGRKL